MTFTNALIFLIFITLLSDDSNLFCKNEDLLDMESNINEELVNIQVSLSANKLSLNIEKSNFVIFHPYQKNLEWMLII